MSRRRGTRPRASTSEREFAAVVGSTQLEHYGQTPEDWRITWGIK